MIEDEAIAMLAAMLGFDPTVARGHFTSGGTVANFEGVWRARYRMDHGLALGLWRAERDGKQMRVLVCVPFVLLTHLRRKTMKVALQYFLYMFILLRSGC